MAYYAYAGDYPSIASAISTEVRPPLTAGGGFVNSSVTTFLLNVDDANDTLEVIWIISVALRFPIPLSDKNPPASVIAIGILSKLKEMAVLVPSPWSKILIPSLFTNMLYLASLSLASN
jgi:hypothetical protein